MIRYNYVGIRTVFIFLIGLVLLVGCGKNKPATPTDSSLSTCPRSSPLATAVQQSYCTNVRTYSGAAITGSANFEYRSIDYSASAPSKGLLAVAGAKPIKFAEIRVTNSSGSEIQCGTTAVDGSFNLDLPLGSENLSISIYPRSNGDKLKASISKCPETPSLYSLTTSVAPSSGKSVGTITAKATGDLLGGAFNIFDQIYNANEFLRAQVGTGTCGGDGCIEVATSLPNVDIFWEKGFNPGFYTGGAGAGATSFYLPSYSRLFLLGGVNGDTAVSDTDHFDNSVILHEYAHFIEDIMSISDSQGGGHDGASLIDPRLAFSEGFGNFFQAAVRNSPVYVDTFGNIDSSTNDFRIELESTLTGFIWDIPSTAGEGNFREFAVSRLLWDGFDDTSESSDDINQTGFPELWTILTATAGFRSTSNAFRSSGLMHQLQSDAGFLPSADNWINIRSINRHSNDKTDYAREIASGAACPITITPSNKSAKADPSDISTLLNLTAGDGSFQNSNLQVNNDFYRYNHAGGNVSFSVDYTTTSGAEADLDLIVYKDRARLGTFEDMISTSQGRCYNDANIGTRYVSCYSDTGQSPPATEAGVEVETIVANNLPAGNYLINVMVYTGIQIGGSTDYNIKINGTTYCGQ